MKVVFSRIVSEILKSLSKMANRSAPYGTRFLSARNASDTAECLPRRPQARRQLIPNRFILHLVIKPISFLISDTASYLYVQLKLGRPRWAIGQ